MITYVKGDIFNSPAQMIVNTVNTVGVMGKGLALQFKNKYPKMFQAYQKVCEEKKFDIGNLFVWKKSDKWVLLFPTKKHWRSPSRIEYIEKGLIKFKNNYQRLGMNSIAFPMLGCGNGGLDWDDVKPLMEKYLSDLPLNIYIYVGQYFEEKPEHENQNFMESWLAKNPSYMGFEGVKEDLLRVIENQDHILLSDSQLEIKHISYEEGQFIIQNGKEIRIPEDYLCSFWNYIRKIGLIEESKLPSEYSEHADILLKLLSKLHYLDLILLLENGADSTFGRNGYQYIEPDFV